MRKITHLAFMFLAFGLLTSGLTSAQAQGLVSPAPGGHSHGVIIALGSRMAGLANLQAGDTPALAGQRVHVQQVDLDVGLLVSSSTMDDADLAQTLMRAGLTAEVNHPRHVLPVTPTAELFNKPSDLQQVTPADKPDFWHVAQLGADIVHRLGNSGSPSLIVGIIDTGVYSGHPQIASSLLPGFDFVHNDTQADDQVGHGTHVAGIVHSICPRCRLLPVKVLDNYEGDDYSIARGIRYARQRGAKIIQISLGGPAPSATLCQSIRAVEAQGAQVVIAAGNSAASSAEWIGYPALCSPSSLVVSAIDRYNLPAWFSNYGPAVDLAAPGLEVWSTIPPFFGTGNFMAASGTSMAAPQVSGGAGLLWSAHPAWTAAQVRARLIATARDISTMAGIDDVYGPRIDIAQALGLRSRPIVVGMSSDRSVLPRAGTDQQRTVQLQAHARGESLTAVRLELTIGGQVQRIPMVDQGNGTYKLSYVVPKDAKYQRELFPHVVAVNSAGATVSQEEVIFQEGPPIPAARIRILNGPPRINRPTLFALDWEGAWDNVTFICGDFSGELPLYLSAGETATCRYGFTERFIASAQLYRKNAFKTYTFLEIEVDDNYVYGPLIGGG
jgi:thermitase